MKITYFVIYYLLVSSIQLVNGQSPAKENPWILGFGFNTINDSGGWVSGLFNISDNYNYSNPYRISVEKRFARNYGIEVSTNFNRFLEGKTINRVTLEEDINIIAVDGMLKYYITNLFLDQNRSFYEGYIALGAGKTFYNGVGDIMTDVGFGANYYITEMFRLNAQATAKFSMENKQVGSNYIQLNLGFIIRLKNEPYY